MITDTLKPAIKALEEAVKAEVALEDMSRVAMYQWLLTKAGQPGETYVRPQERTEVIETLLNRWYSYDALQAVMDDPLVTDITAVGSHTTIIRKNGVHRESTESTFDSEKALLDFINRQLQDTPYGYSLKDPIANGILPGGFRFNIAGGDGTRWTVNDGDGLITTVPATIMTIRKPLYPFNLDDLQELGTFDSQTREFFRLMQAIGDTFVIAGGTGSTKTSLMSALTGDIPDDQKVIVVEEIAELIPLNKLAIRLTNRDKTGEGLGEITMERNLINTLRMDPDVMYIGEVRDSKLIYLFLRAALAVRRQTGTTFHTNINFERATNDVLMRFIEEGTEGAGVHGSRLNTASIFANKVRHVISMSITRDGPRVVEIGEIVDFDHIARTITWIPVVRYDHEERVHRFNGISEKMYKRAAIQGIKVGLKQYSGGHETYFIA